MAITLQESLRGMFYAPFYVALAREAYAAEGVTVHFASAPTPGRAALGVSGWHGRCVLGRADAGHAGLCPGAGLRPRAFRRSGDARSFSSARPHAAAGFRAGAICWACASARSARCRRRGCACKRICAAPAWHLRGLNRVQRSQHGGQCRGPAAGRAGRGAGVRAVRRGAGGGWRGACLVCGRAARADQLHDVLYAACTCCATAATNCTAWCARSTAR